MQKTMKALVKKERGVGLWLEEVPVPSYGINDVLIKIDKTSICGTDVHIWNWDAWAQKTIPVPMVIGHEFVGKVAAFGSNVTDLAVGDVVAVIGARAPEVYRTHPRGLEVLGPRHFGFAEPYVPIEALVGQWRPLLAARDALPARYLILERSADLRERQRDRIAAVVPQWLDRVEWLEQPPEQAFDGAIVGNEVVLSLIHISEPTRPY